MQSLGVPLSLSKTPNRILSLRQLHASFSDYNHLSIITDLLVYKPRVFVVFSMDLHYRNFFKVDRFAHPWFNSLSRGLLGDYMVQLLLTVASEEILCFTTHFSNSHPAFSVFHPPFIYPVLQRHSYVFLSNPFIYKQCKLTCKLASFQAWLHLSPHLFHTFIPIPFPFPIHYVLFKSFLRFLTQCESHYPIVYFYGNNSRRR